ncbi:MAG: IS3 family transposase [Actinobacteria bacterium]|nr:IS3 family transposase [Actinomycetota bacterium]
MELRLGRQERTGRKRVARLMRLAGLVGAHQRRQGGCTRRDPAATPNPDLVRRQFKVDAPDALWVTDISEHPTAEGKVYVAAVIDAYSRRAIGWSIADHMRSELVVDALQMALWRRRPPAGKTICHSDHGTQYTSWAFGRRLRAAGLLGSMGSIGNCFDNCMAESFFGTLQVELLDRHQWRTAGSWLWPSSSTWRPSTIRYAGIRRWGISARLSSKAFTTRSNLLHDQLSQSVRRTGSISGESGDPGHSLGRLCLRNGRPL